MSSEERGTETKSFNAVFGARLGARVSLRRSLQNLSLQAAPRHRPIASFWRARLSIALEQSGLELDHSSVDFRRLRAFHLVAKYGSLRRAANQLGLTLPTLSVQLKKLEYELNVKLFHHLPNKLLITEQGHLFLQEITRVLEALERAKATVSNQTDDFTGKVSISMGSDLGKYFAPRIALFIKHHPRLALTILARPSRETLSLVLGGEVDFGIGRFSSTPRGMHREKLLENGVCLVFPRDHPLSRKHEIGLTDIAAFRIITLTRNSETRKLVDSAFHRNRIEPEKILEVGTCQSAIDFVRLGLGVSLVHDICVAGDLKKLHFVNMSHVFGKAEVSLIRRTNAIITPAQTALMNAFIDAASNTKLPVPSRRGENSIASSRGKTR